MLFRLLFASLLVVACGDNLPQMDKSACKVDTDCPAAGSDECITERCVDGQCLTTNVATGTPVTNQTPGDCRKNVCDGAGNITTDADDTDTPPPVTCEDVSCSNGKAVETPSAMGTACGTGMTCDGSGSCT
jgi:hypothetical protein